MEHQKNIDRDRKHGRGAEYGGKGGGCKMEVFGVGFRGLRRFRGFSFSCSQSSSGEAAGRGEKEKEYEY